MKSLLGFVVDVEYAVMMPLHKSRERKKKKFAFGAKKRAKCV
jgi:hypothetical protein